MATHGHGRHQLSLEAILDFSEPFSLESRESEKAQALLNTLITGEHVSKRYSPGTLIKTTLDHVKSKDSFLMFFLSFMYSALSSDVQPHNTHPHVSHYLEFFDGVTLWDPATLNDVSRVVGDFAEWLIENFFLPRMANLTEGHLGAFPDFRFPVQASSLKTPQPTPTSLSSIETPTPAGTPQRLSNLRAKCLIRDRHRCVVSRAFDRAEALKRYKHGGVAVRDDDGQLFQSAPTDRYENLELAHILPHSLMAAKAGTTELTESKKLVLKILDMFDPGIVHLIEPPNIDSPLNAITLTLNYHRMFGEFEIYFEPTGEPYQYRITSTQEASFLRDPLFPVTRTLTLSPKRTIDPPSPRLLALHRAIAQIMHLSGAGDYIESILRDLEEVDVKADGTTNLGYLMKLSLGGWLDTTPVH